MGFCWKKTMVVFCWLTISLFSWEISAKLPRFEHPSKGDGSLRFLVVGDWGRKGEFNQSEVAFQVFFFIHSLVIFFLLKWARLN